MFCACMKICHNLFNGLRLIAGGNILTFESEGHIILCSSERKLNRMEDIKMSVKDKFFERQIVAYDQMMREITNLDLLEVEKTPAFGRKVAGAIIDIIEAFQRNSMFLDTNTCQIFSERILCPFLNHDFDVVIDNGRYSFWYKELRSRLCGEVAPCMKNFFQSRFPDFYK